MRTQLVLSVIIGIVGFPLLVVAFVSHLILGIALAIPFVDALLMLVASLIYIALFLGPLTALSWLWLKLPLLRIPIAIVGIPWALLGNTFTVLIPVPPDEADSRITKLLFTAVWPYSLRYWQWDVGTLDWDEPRAAELTKVLDRETRNVPPQRNYLERVMAARAASAATEPQEPTPDVTVDDLMSALRESVDRSKREQEGRSPT